MSTDTIDVFNGCSFKMGALDKLFHAIEEAQLLPEGITEYRVLKDRVRDVKKQASISTIIQCTSNNRDGYFTPFEYGYDSKKQSFYCIQDLGYIAYDHKDPNNFKDLLFRSYDDFLSKFDTNFKRRSTDEDRMKFEFLTQQREDVINDLLRCCDPAPRLIDGWKKVRPTSIQSYKSGREQTLKLL